MSDANPGNEASSTRWIDLGICIAGLAVSLVIALVTYMVAIAPMETLERSFQSRIATAAHLTSQGPGLQKQHHEVNQQLTANEVTFTTMLERIPETPHESEFLAQITEVARDCQLKIQKFHPKEPVNEGTYTALEVQLDATASYAGICRFLDGMRTLPRLCRVTRLRMQATTADGEELPMEMTLRIYFAPLNKSPKT